MYKVIYQNDCQYCFSDWYGVDVDVWIVMFFGDYFYFFVKVVNCMIGNGNIGGRFQCDVGNDLLVVVDVVKNVVGVVVLEFGFGDFIVVFVVVQFYYFEVVVNFYFFYGVDVYQCVGDIGIQVVEDWFIEVWWYVVSYYCYFCVNGVVFFFQVVYQFIQGVDFIWVWIEEGVLFNLILIFDGQWNIVYLCQVVVNDDVEFCGKVFFGNCFGCYVYCGFVCRRMIVVVIVVQIIFLFVGVIGVVWMEQIFDCVVIL